MDYRATIERIFDDEGMIALDADAEYELRHEDFVMEMPQSGERMRGRDKLREMQKVFPNPPKGKVRRITGAGEVWVVEGVNDYGGGDVWSWVVIMEFRDGKIWKETRYYGKPFEAPAWRAQWVEPLD
jgi:hypothetical protein